jgi:hypothetical protein
VETPVVVVVGRDNILFSHLHDFYQYELDNEPPPPYMSPETIDLTTGMPASLGPREVQADQSVTLSVLESDTHTKIEVLEGDSFWDEPSPIEATATPTSSPQVIEIEEPWSQTVVTWKTAALHDDL